MNTTKKTLLILLSALFSFVSTPLYNATSACAEETAAVAADEPESSSTSSKEEDDGHSVLHVIFWYLPNRVFDIFDIARVRARVGPGFAVDARVTKFASVYAGTYATVYAGLPGPRNRKLPRLPVGLESHNGATVSVVDATADGGIGPDYGSTEVGAGFQLAIIGFDFGIDPGEMLDLLLGFATIDIKDDDF